MAAGRGTLTMQRLGVRLIEQRNPEDAIVLGDAMQTEGIDGLITGRSRPVMFHAAVAASGSHFGPALGEIPRITTRDELHMIARTRIEQPAFFVQGYEAIYNVGHFAAKPDEEQWDKIWTMWITPRRATYRALVDARLLPSTIRFHELQWRGIILPPADVLLADALYLVRVPPRRKKPISAYVFSVVRHDEDNPRTRGSHFYEDYPNTWTQQRFNFDEER